MTDPVTTVHPSNNSTGGVDSIDGIDDDIINSPFLASPATHSLRITCYGSSSSRTPAAYLQTARHVGYLLACRGHVCVNGAGNCGCMAALNDGAVRGQGQIVGVFHRMWLVDGPIGVFREGGAHAAFAHAIAATELPPADHNSDTTTTGPRVQVLFAEGENLQERKRLLVENSNGVIVLPGGPGTWDELWEMACVRNLGLIKLPIVCVNVNGFYDPFRQMLERAYQDELTKLRPDEIVHFEETAEAAVKWIEAAQSSQNEPPIAQVAKRSPFTIPRSSFLSEPAAGNMLDMAKQSVLQDLDMVKNARDELHTTKDSCARQWKNKLQSRWLSSIVLYGVGVATGILFVHLGRQHVVKL